MIHISKSYICETNQNQVEQISFCKTVLMLLVIFYHSCVFWTGNWFPYPVVYESKFIYNLACWLNSFHIYAFTVISGYLFSYSKYTLNKYKVFSEFMLNKVRRLLIPFLFVSVIWVIPIGQAFFKYDRQTFIKRYVFATSPNQLWFLLMLFWCFLFAWLVSNHIQKWTAFSVGISLLSFALGLVLGHFVPNYFCVLTAFSYFPFFVLGMKLRDWKWLTLIPAWVYVLVDVIVFLIYQYLQSLDNGLYVILLNVVLSFALHLVGALMAWSCLQWLGTLINWKKSKVFTLLSRYSMPMYLFHQQIIYFCIYLFNGRINQYLNVIVNFIIAVLCSMLISYMLMKWKITRFLIGEK